MRWLLGVALLVVGAGCVSEPSPQGPADDVAQAECPILYPDNSTFDCTNGAIIREGIVSSRPGVEDGWFCHAHNDNDDGYGTLDLLMQRDGRLGFWWTTTWTRPGGVMFVQASVYYGDGSGDVAVVAFQPTGFVELPFRSKGEVADVHLLVRHHLLDVKVGDAAWYEDRNATLLVGRFQGDPWYVWRYTVEGETQHLDTMVYAPADGAKWLVRNQFHETTEHSAYATVSAMGAKFLQIPMTVDPYRHASCQV